MREIARPDCTILSYDMSDAPELSIQAALLDQTHDAVIMRDIDDRIVLWNQGAERVYGWQTGEALGQNIYTLLFHKDSRHVMDGRPVYESSATGVAEVRHIRKDQKEVIVESRWKRIYDHAGRPRAVLFVNSDVTEKKMLEVQLLRAQRMVSMGMLVSGIVHDLNNTFSSMLLAVRTLESIRMSPSGRRWLKTLQINAEYAGHLANQLLSFAKGGDVQSSSIQMAQLIRETVEVIRSAFPSSIAIKTVIPPNLWTISGNPTSLHQMLMNLCINAREAMPRGGKLTIEVANIDRGSSDLPAGAKPVKHVRLEVADSGCGVPDKIRDKLFDPFFTTKRNKGAGLGLFTVARVVDSQHGHIEVLSKVKQGTRFRIFLPAEMPENKTRTFSL